MLRSTIIGLTNKEAEERRKIYGKNEIRRTIKISPFKIFLSQFTSPLIIILILAALISVFISYLPGQRSNFIDVALILIIVFVSGISGFFQEYKAEKSIEALQQLATPNIEVIRDGVVAEIPSTELTVGDVILLEPGDIVPADGEIIESYALKVDESILTGESAAVEKKDGDMVFMNTSVNVGSAKVQIAKIGMKTKVGMIAEKLQNIETTKTSFETEVENLSRKIFIIVSVITVIIFISNFFKYDLYSSLLTAVSLAVAAIPEGLPAVVVLSLAIGAKTMHKNNALIRKLGVVESIGAVDIICSDKTGTITKNEMSVSKLYVDGKVIDLGAVAVKATKQKDMEFLVQCGVICNNVKAEGHPEGKRKYFGEQTEVSLVKIGEKFNLSLEGIRKRFVRVSEIPFSPERKMMSVAVRDSADKNSKFKIFFKGAPEVILGKCDRILINGKVKKLTVEEKKIILTQNDNFAANALRVLGFAYKIADNLGENIEEKLIWIGLQAMIDPPHPEMKKVINDCKTAGIRVIMITGDNSVTAAAVANLIGLESSAVVSGKALDKMNDKELKEKLKKGVNIFARTNPFHKLKILKVLNKTNRVAMTGDGVNDSLALKQADVGVAMGLKGTTVAKESSDIVLLDDNFSTIITAVREGRRIFDNIRKFINYLLVSNIAEVLILFLSVFTFNLKDPILFPAQILWINLLTDGLPALALGADPARKDIMREPPRRKGEHLIDKKLGSMIAAIGIKKTLVLLITFFLVLPAGEEIARTTLFTGFILYEFVRIASIRSQEKLSWFSNPWLVLALIISLLLQLLVVYSPLNSFFHAVKLGTREWVILAGGTVIGYILALIITKIIIYYFGQAKRENNFLKTAVN